MPEGFPQKHISRRDYRCTRMRIEEVRLNGLSVPADGTSAMLSRAGREQNLMNIRLCFCVVALSLVGACGDSESAEPARELITWSVGDIDPFGCVYVVPEPWVSGEVHREACSEGCDRLRAGHAFVG